jgi:hypothetical protein
MQLLDERGRALANRLLRNSDALVQIVNDSDTSPAALTTLIAAFWLLVDLAYTLEHALAFGHGEVDTDDHAPMSLHAVAAPPWQADDGEAVEGSRWELPTHAAPH